MEPAGVRALIAADRIAERVAGLGREVADSLPAGPLVVVGVLRGAFIFMADLVRALPREHRCDFLSVRSYGDATETSGVVEITGDLLLPIEGQHVLLVEDIVDTGLTLKYLLDLLGRAGRPACTSVPCCPSRRGGGSRSRWTSSASRSRTCSWSATGWTPASATATCPTWPSSSNRARVTLQLLRASFCLIDW